MEFSKWLRTQRIRNGLTQMELQQKTDLGDKYISHLETGRVPRPQEETRKKIHRALGTSDEDLAQAGILERIDTGSGYIYIWPIDSTPAPRPMRNEEPMELSQVMSEIECRAKETEITRSMLESILLEIERLAKLRQGR